MPMNTMAQRQKLIFINRYFYPDHSATSQMLSDLAFGLAKTETGREIHIDVGRNKRSVSGDECPPMIAWNAALIPAYELPAYEIIDKVHIHRVNTTRFGRHNLLGRAIDYLSFYIASFATLIKLTNKDDTLIAKTDPPLISLIAALVATLKKAHLVNWLQDLFPEVAKKHNIDLTTF
jgi:colanic acid biosynthesis glycosyl transferase WcaI